MNKSTLTIFFILSLLIFSDSTRAQKVSLDDDTVKVGGIPYAILKTKSAGPMRSDFTVNGLSGTELIYFKSMTRSWSGSGFRYGNGEELYFEATFIATGSRADLKYYSKNGFAKLIVENNLVKGNTIDPESEKRFIQLNNGTTPSATNKNQPDNSPVVVVNINNNAGGTGDDSPKTPVASVPKSKSPVIINGNKIMLDDVVIGKFRQDTTTSTYSQKTILITVYSEGGEKVAEAAAPFANPQEWIIKILSEDKSFNIMYDAPNEREKLFKWLADKNYLKN